MKTTGSPHRPSCWSVAAIAALLCLVAGAPRIAAAETLLAIPAFGVDPASSGYDQWTNLLSVAYGVGSSPVGDRRVLPPDLNTITVIKECDASSPKLLEAAADGTVFSEMQIDFVNENQLVFARLKLGSASVATYIFRGASPGDELPLEQVTFNFERIAASQTDRSETATQEFFFDQFSGELKFSTFLPGSGTPSLVLPGPQVGLQDEPVTFAVLVSDPDTPVEDLKLSASSSNPALFPEGAISFGGEGGQRSVEMIPAEGETGSAEVEITVSDGQNSTSQSLLVLVNPDAASGYLISLTPNTIDEHSPAGTPIGALDTTPGLPGPFEMVDSAAGLVRLAGDGKTIVVNNPVNLDFERQPRPSIVVRTPSPGGAGFIYADVVIEVQNVIEGYFDIWREKHFSPAELLDPDISGFWADADGDELKNGVECALDLPPRDGTVPPHAPRLVWTESGGKEFVTIRFRRLPAAIDPDTRVIPEHSEALRAWDPDGFTVVAEPTTNDAGDPVEEVAARYELSADQARRIQLRLRIQR